MLTFNGSYTIQNKESGEHRTFRVKTQKQDANFAPGERIVALLSGPNNESDYRGFGFVKENGIIVWTKHRYPKLKNSNMSAFEFYAFLLWQLTTNPDSEWHHRYSIQLEKHCIRCNRKLTHPESIETGIGPECAKMI